MPAVSLVDRRGGATEVFRFGDGELGHPPLVSIHQPSFERVMVSALETARHRPALGASARLAGPSRPRCQRLGAALGRRARHRAASAVSRRLRRSPQRRTRSAGRRVRRVDVRSALAGGGRHARPAAGPRAAPPLRRRSGAARGLSAHVARQASLGVDDPSRRGCGALSRAGADRRADEAVDHGRAGRGRASGDLHVPRAPG